MQESAIRFYQTGTWTVGNRLLDPTDRTVQSSQERHNALNSGHRACQGCGEALGARYAVDAAFAATNACPMENTSVQFVRISLAAKYFTARIPAAVQGSFTTMRGCSAASTSPSRTIPSKSVAMTSALTSPSTMLQIST